MLVFAGLGAVLAAAFATLNHVLGPKRPNAVKSEPYECGLPSEFTTQFRFGISFYVTAMLYLVFGIEIILLYPVALMIGIHESAYALAAGGLFLVLLTVAFVFEWARGSLDWSR